MVGIERKKTDPKERRTKKRAGDLVSQARPRERPKRTEFLRVGFWYRLRVR